ncbi:hypothetical protein C2S53_005633 [Perilla frutescens var. hirtella]|uniref:Secreted protein n=1 Tax=Perilla frutescens var. hirtella TaxID=608512 RepID=A0AAD4P9S9_PERFH|nr:hypothetical protein C2S53_005633 [Perilla frutescens var. hirtella]
MMFQLTVARVAVLLQCWQGMARRCSAGILLRAADKGLSDDLNCDHSMKRLQEAQGLVSLLKLFISPC